MNSTEKCVKAIASFNMFDGYVILTYTDGTQDHQKVDFNKVRQEYKSEQSKNRREFAKKHGGFRVSSSMLKLFDLVAFGGYHTNMKTIKALKEDPQKWQDLRQKMSKAQGTYRRLKAKKCVAIIDKLVNIIAPGYNIGQNPKDWKFPDEIKFSAPVGNKELADALIHENLLPKNFYK